MQLKHYLSIYLKGMAMGAADVVPGISGGTVAFITGIYEELLHTLQSINPKTALILFKEGPKPFWQAMNGNFIVSLLAGIVTSFALLAHIITNVMQSHPIPLWAFFFGLVLASSWLIAKEIDIRKPIAMLALLVGLVTALVVTMSTPMPIEPSFTYVFFAGAIAICAMILPGISGSFILLLLGLYGFILESVKGFDIDIILTFVAGCGVGLLSFVHLLSWLLRRYRSATMALLTGFLVGSLNALWPWKQVISTYVSSKGSKPLEQVNIWPEHYSVLNQGDNQLIWAIAMMIMGLLFVIVLDKFSHSGECT